MRPVLLLALLLADAASLRLALQTAGGALVLAWLLLALLAGFALIRRQGLQTLGALRAATTLGEWPTLALWQGLLALVAGLLLILPGAASDLLALPLLLPALRRSLAQRLAGGHAAPVVIEGEFRETSGNSPLPPAGEGKTLVTTSSPASTRWRDRSRTARTRVPPSPDPRC